MESSLSPIPHAALLSAISDVGITGFFRRGGVGVEVVG